MSRWVQLDRIHLKKRGFFYKIPLIILVVAALVMGYHHVTGKPALRDVIERQFSQIDDLKDSFEKQMTIDEDTKKEMNTTFQALYQTYAQENGVYTVKGKTERLIPIYEKRLELVEFLLGRGSQEWADSLESPMQIRAKLQLFHYLVEKEISYQTYYQYGDFIQTIFQLLGYGILVFFFLVQVGGYLERKQRHRTLLEVVPISNKEELLTETLYSLKYFYAFPSLLVILSVVAHGILIQENVFLFPVSYISNGETIFISATQGILLSIGYLLLAIVGLFIAQMLLFSLVKDTMVSAIVLFILGYLSIGGYSLGSILSISVLPALQQGVPLVIGAFVGMTFSIIFIGLRLKNIRK
jgi:membrane permease